MPTEQEIASYISQIRPLPLFALPPNDHECPICLEPYTLHECPVKVQSLHPRTRCQHVFGRDCIEKHFRSGGPWRTRCPMCKEEWFDDETWGTEDVESGSIWADMSTEALGMTEERQFVSVRVPQRLRIRIRSRPNMRGGESLSQTVDMQTSVENEVMNGEGEDDAWGSDVEHEGSGADEEEDEVEDGEADISHQEPNLENGEVEAAEQALSTSAELPDHPVGRLNRFKVENCVELLNRLLFTAEIDVSL
jgi:hypothetical protein